MNDSGEEDKVYKVEKILEKKYNSSEKCHYYLIRWKGYSSKYDSYEPESNLVSCPELLKSFNSKRKRSPDDTGGVRRKRRKTKLVKFIPGFKNSSQMCYFNTVFQILVNMPSLCTYFIYYTGDNEILQLFTKFYRDLLESCDSNFFNCRFFFKSLRTHSAYLQHYQRDVQSDVQEFYSSLLTVFREELPTPFYNSMFTIELFSVIQCQNCRFETCTSSQENHLSLGLQRNSLKSILCDFFELEELKGDNMIQCSKCSVLSCANKRLLFKKLPRILTIQLKRFERGVGSIIKINKEIELSKKLLFTVYMGDGKRQRKLKYKLFAVLCHDSRGLKTVKRGHFYVCIRRLKIDVVGEDNVVGKRENSWTKINDAKVEKLRSFEMINKKECYLLFYENVPLVNTKDTLPLLIEKRNDGNNSSTQNTSSSIDELDDEDLFNTLL